MQVSVISSLNFEDVKTELSNGDGYKLIDINSYHGSHRALTKYILQGFSSQFGIKNANLNDMKYIHLFPEYSSIFKSLSVQKRTLNHEISTQIMNEVWLKELCEATKMYPVDTYGNGYPSFTWRLTRPSSPNDFRPYHRDTWFRMALGNKEIIDPTVDRNLQIIRVWIAIEVVPGMAGLSISKGSQNLSELNFDIVNMDGTKKPQVRSSDLDGVIFETLITPPGTIVIFSERLLHGGAPTTSKTSRISMEFSLASCNQDTFNIYYE